MNCQGHILNLPVDKHMEWKWPKLLEDVDFRFLIKATSNLLNLNARQENRANHMELKCRRCDLTEDQVHVINLCFKGNYIRIQKHNKVQNRLVSLLRTKLKDIEVNTSPHEVQTTLRPDIIIRRPDEIMLLDVKIPWDSSDTIKAARLANKEKYRGLAADIQSATGKYTHVETFVVGSLGTWDKRNNDVLRGLGFDFQDFRTFKDKMIAAAITGSRQTYDEHRGIRR